MEQSYQGFILHLLMRLFIIFREYSKDLNSLHMGTKNFKLTAYIAEIPMTKTE